MTVTTIYPSASSHSFVALSGGVGGAKMALGLSRILSPSQLSIVANTGDDFEHLGLYICPDIDTVLYTLGGVSNTETGWGRAGETWEFMAKLERDGGETWFKLGDKDVALHVERTRHLHHGESLTQVTQKLARDLGIEHSILPMCDEPVRTIVATDEGRLPFQHYFVREQCRPRVSGFHFEGIEQAHITDAALSALQAPSLGGVLICPSNPFVSIDPILTLPGMRHAIKASGVPVVAVSPIIAGVALKGPAAKMMAELGVPATTAAIAKHYAGFIDALIIDYADKDLSPAIEAMGVKTLVMNTVMTTLEDRVILAREAVNLASELFEDKAKGAAS